MASMNGSGYQPRGGGLNGSRPPQSGSGISRDQESPARNGYAASPGTGPDRESCGSCRHLFRRQMKANYYKCFLMREIWTEAPATDIDPRSQACRCWEPLPTHGKPVRRDQDRRGW